MAKSLFSVSVFVAVLVATTYCSPSSAAILEAATVDQQSNNSSLRFVTVIWRHGDRSPSHTFPTDTENGARSWPQGFGELTTIGMKQHEALGRYLRKRYVEDAKFLSENYFASEVYIRSTSYNRTLMSALSNLAAMYPRPNNPNGGIFENDGFWQPIPVHSQPRESDPMLWSERPCPTSDSVYWNEVMQSKEVKQIELDNKPLLDFIKEKTGLKKMNFHEIWDVWDPLFCEKAHNSTHNWPSWVTEDIFENITRLLHLSTTFYFHDPRVRRLRGSLLFNDIAVRMDQKAHRPAEIRPSSLKYYVYSAHDTTIMALLENLGAYNGINPAYASAVMFELHEKVSGQYTVETWYLNETWAASPPILLSVQGCGGGSNATKFGEDECNLDRFVQLAKKAAPASEAEWYAECGLTPEMAAHAQVVSQAGTTIAVVMGILAGISLAAFLVTLILYLKLKKTSGNPKKIDILHS